MHRPPVAGIRIDVLPYLVSSLATYMARKAEIYFMSSVRSPNLPLISLLLSLSLFEGLPVPPVTKSPCCIREASLEKGVFDFRKEPYFPDALRIRQISVRSQVLVSNSVLDDDSSFFSPFHFSSGQSKAFKVKLYPGAGPWPPSGGVIGG